MSRNHSHYYKDVAHLREIDVYRVLQLFGVTDPCVQHAVKKLLCAGGRGAKDHERDLREAGDSINRALQMIAEDCNAGVLAPRPESKTVNATLEVKVDPAATMMTRVADVLGKPNTHDSVKIKLLEELFRNVELKPFVVDRNEAAVAQGVDFTWDPAQDLSERTVEQLSKDRAAMPQFAHRMSLSANSEMAPLRKEAVSDREVDSYTHIAAGIKGTSHGS